MNFYSRQSRAGRRIIPKIQCRIVFDTYAINTLPILGVDATTEGLDLISQGAMACTIFQPAKGQGEAAVKAAEKLASGQSVASLDGAEHNGLFVWVPFEQVTAENLSQYQ